MIDAGARRLLLVSTNYAPETAGTSRYATQIAEHWAARGACVDVVAGMPHYPAWRLDPAYAGVRQVREERGGVQVHRHAHTVPARQTALRHALFEVSLLRGASATAAALPRPDLVAAQMPSLAAGVVGARLAARHGVPFLPLVRNLLGARAAAVRAVERYALRRAALVAVAHETLIAGVAALGVPEERIRLVPNWSLVPRASRPRAQMRALLGWRTGQTVLLACGPGALSGGHGVAVLVAAARLDPGLRVVVMAESDVRERLRALAGGLPNLDLAPPPRDAELPDVLAAADVLAVTDPAVPPVLTSYFAAGRPIVAAVGADSGTARELARAGAGLAVPPSDAAALCAAVRSLAADPAQAAQGPAYAASHLTRAAALSYLDDLLAEALTLAVPHGAPAAAGASRVSVPAGRRGSPGGRAPSERAESSGQSESHQPASVPERPEPPHPPLPPEPVTAPTPPALAALPTSPIPATPPTSPIPAGPPESPTPPVRPKPPVPPAPAASPAPPTPPVPPTPAEVPTPPSPPSSPAPPEPATPPVPPAPPTPAVPATPPRPPVPPVPAAPPKPPAPPAPRTAPASPGGGEVGEA